MRERNFYTPQEVGNLVGFSASFIRGEIKAGELEAVYVKPRGRSRGRWLITVTVALAYARRLGSIKDAAQLHRDGDWVIPT